MYVFSRVLQCWAGVSEKHTFTQLCHKQNVPLLIILSVQARLCVTKWAVMIFFFLCEEIYCTKTHLTQNEWNHTCTGIIVSWHVFQQIFRMFSGLFCYHDIIFNYFSFFKCLDGRCLTHKFWINLAFSTKVKNI